MNNFVLTAENYHSTEARKIYTGASQYKDFMDCEARALAIVNGEWQEEETTAMLVGSYVDAHFEGKLDLFIAQHPQICTKDGKLRADYTYANDIIARIERDAFMMKYLSGKKQVIMTGEICGVPVKIKIDSYHEGKAIVDQKIMRDMNDVWIAGKGYTSFVDAWGYDIQGAIYQAVERNNLPFILAVATKEKPEPNIEMLSIPQDKLDEAMAGVVSNLPRIQAIKKGIVAPTNCGKCDYCRHHKVLDKVIEYTELGDAYAE